MKKIILLLTLSVATGCSNKVSLRDYFINISDSYWAYYDEADPGFHGVYYQFTKDGKVNRYCRSYDNQNILKICAGSDVIETDIDWKVSNDSILTWGLGRYKIITCNESLIALYMKGTLPRHKFLIKEYSGKLRKGKALLEDQDYPTTISLYGMLRQAQHDNTQP